MSERDAAARPGIAPTARCTAGTMFAALYGELVPHPWHGPESEHDAYQFFHQRSLAMGWLDDRATVAEKGASEERGIAPGLWAMNDAGWSHPHAPPEPKLVSWFEVEASSVADDRPLPVQPFLRCAQDTTNRIGALRLTAVQVLLPVHGIVASARPAYAMVPSLQTPDWFGEFDPESRASVRVRVDSGRDPSARDAAPQLVDYLGHLDQNVFADRPDGNVASGGFPVPPFYSRFWNGPPLHGVTLSGELAEWFCDAVGWLAETVADSAAQVGIRMPLLLTVTLS